MEHFAPVVEHAVELAHIDLTPAAVALVAVLLDVVFGLVQAGIRRDFKSSKLRAGLGHKAGEVGAVVAAYTLQVALLLVDMGSLGVDVTLSVPLGLAVSAYIVVMEIGSMVEHCVALNPELADSRFFRIFAQAGVDAGKEEGAENKEGTNED